MAAMKTRTAYTIVRAVRITRGDDAYEYGPGVVKPKDAAEVRALESLVKQGIAKRGASKPKE
jgi:hypothetical protein